MTLLDSLARRFGQAKAIGQAAMGGAGPQQTPMSSAAPMTPAAPAGGTEMQAQPGMAQRVGQTIGSMFGSQSLPAQAGESLSRAEQMTTSASSIPANAQPTGAAAVREKLRSEWSTPGVRNPGQPAGSNAGLAYGKLPEQEMLPMDVAAEDEPLPAPGLIRTTPPRRTDTLARYQQILRRG